MAINRAGRLLKRMLSLCCGEIPIIPARQYTYLGAQANLQLQEYLHPRSMIDLNHPKKNIVFKLFDVLIMPVVSYSCKAWLLEISIMMRLATNCKLELPKVAHVPLERVHMTFLKWTRGGAKFIPNAAIWGDTGRYPLQLICIAKVELERLHAEKNPAFSCHTFTEINKLRPQKWSK